MKNIYKILIILSFMLSLYVARDDIKLAVNDIASNYKVDDSASLVKLIAKEKVEPLNKIDMPGALRVVNGYLNDNKLSKDNIIKYTNNYRNEFGGLTKLTENSKLNLSAENKLQDMFDNQYFEHISPSGVGVGDLGVQAGYDYILIGENLALGNFSDDLDLVDAWMASAGHRANILNERYTEIGIAVGKGVFEGRSIWMAIQHFGTPRSVCPAVDQVLLGLINLNQNKLKSMEEDLAIRKSKIDVKAIYEESTYYEQIDKYNILVNTYNELIADTKQKIINYNEQINAFNLCLEGTQ
ncbi:MAG: CAP domain-containing protein [Candidatus Pacebacteria bacterium]|nr:CAP domain-containing protein [Candidatus Paceibacterota bacterium]